MSSSEKLTESAARDYPTASKILVSFPDRWDLVQAFNREDTPLYVAGFSPSHEQTRGDHFLGLSPEVNRSLTVYRHYRLFQPWPTPIVPVMWNNQAGVGQVVEGGRLEVQLRPLGDAQAWSGETDRVLWECYISPSHRQPKIWQQELATFWQTVERDMEVTRIFTLPHEPTFEEGYTLFLNRLGYAPDPDFPQWWHKLIDKQTTPEP